MLRICIFLKLATSIQAKLEGYIVGGSYAEILSFPHAAWLEIYCTSRYGELMGHYVCGASILNQELLVTAAHCINLCSSSESRIVISMGDKTRGKGVIRYADSFLIHEKYHEIKIRNDIALVKMSKPVKFNSRVSRIAIMKNPPYFEPAQVAGWGSIIEDAQIYPEELKKLDQKVLEHQVCENLLHGLSRGKICASSQSQKNLIERGDSGSGLVVRGYIMIGVTSYKYLHTAKQIAIYTDVAFYYDWIQDNAKRLYCYNRS